MRSAIADRESEVSQRFSFNDQRIIDLVITEFQPANGDADTGPLPESQGDAGRSFAVVNYNLLRKLLNRKFVLHRGLLMQRGRDT